MTVNRRPVVLSVPEVDILTDDSPNPRKQVREGDTAEPLQGNVPDEVSPCLSKIQQTCTWLCAKQIHTLRSKRFLITYCLESEVLQQLHQRQRLAAACLLPAFAIIIRQEVKPCQALAYDCTEYTSGDPLPPPPPGGCKTDQYKRTCRKMVPAL